MAVLNNFNVPLDGYYFCQNYISLQFQRQNGTSAVQNVTNSKTLAHNNNKNTNITHQADHDNGPFGRTQQQTTKMTIQNIICRLMFTIL